MIDLSGYLKGCSVLGRAWRCKFEELDGLMYPRGSRGECSLSACFSPVFPFYSSLGVHSKDDVIHIQSVFSLLGEASPETST